MTEIEQLARRLDELEKRCDEYRTLYLEALERCRKLERGLLAQKSEHVPDGTQLSLDVLSMILNDRQRAELEAAIVLARLRPDPWAGWIAPAA